MDGEEGASERGFISSGGQGGCGHVMGADKGFEGRMSFEEVK